MPATPKPSTEPADGASAPARAFRVFGLDCAEEVAALKSEVGPLVGGAEKLSFDLLKGRMSLAGSATPVSDAAIEKAVTRAGLRAEAWRPETEGRAAPGRRRRLQAALTAASGAAVLAGIGLHLASADGLAQALALFAGHGGGAMPWPEQLAYGLAVAIGARIVVVKAYRAARRLRPDMNLLMVIAVTGALALGQWFEAATVSFLFGLSLTLEGWSVGRARRAIGELLALAPATVRVRGEGGAEREIPVADAAPATHFLVKPGERIGLDGRVVAGTSAVDQAPITGESLPVAKRPGSEVFAGTINGAGALEVASTKRVEETTLARIIRLVEEAQGRRARAEQWVEKFARVYTPIVIALATVVALGPPLLAGAPWDEWFYRALVLLVIACPCALVISTPVSVVAALAAAASQGVLVKGGLYIELPRRLEAIAFDKTGTLTRGRPRVVEVAALDSHTPDGLLRRAAALEGRSAHPLAGAIAAEAAARGIGAARAEAVRIEPGKGVTGRVEGEPMWLGSHRFVVERGHESERVRACARAFESRGCSVVAIGTADHVCGLIAVADTPRPEAARAMAALRAAGIAHLVMLTGDNRASARAIAEAAGIDEVEAELLPEDKVDAVAALVEAHGTVAMVGDGVNDAPAMARASLGIAMGAIGSDAAIETADIALMTDDLTRLAWLVAHSRRTARVIGQNVAFALAVKALFVALAFAGLATLWGAIAADVGASLLVVANALRLLHPKSG